MKPLFLAAALLLAFAAPAQACTSEYVTHWVEQATSMIFTFNAENFDRKKEANRAYFTDEGHIAFYRMMADTGIKEELAANTEAVKMRRTCVTRVTPPSEKNNLWLVEAETLRDRVSTKGLSRTDRLRTTFLISTTGTDNSERLGIVEYMEEPVAEGEDFFCNAKAQMYLDLDERPSVNSEDAARAWAERRKELEAEMRMEKEKAPRSLNPLQRWKNLQAERQAKEQEAGR